MNKIISKQRVANYFSKVESQLFKTRNRSKVLLTRPWASSHCNDAGIYGFFVDGEIHYVGETGCLGKRMGDLLNTKNHCYRRSLGKKLFSKVKGFEIASSSKSFPVHIETRLNRWIINHVEVSCVPIIIGRKEFEEWLQNKKSEIRFLNKRTKRK